MATINHTIKMGISLAASGSYASPLTITSAGAVVNSGGDAIYGYVTSGTVVNQGTVAATGGSGFGVNLSAGTIAVIGNTGPTALISGSGDGIYLLVYSDASAAGAAVVTNSGTIRGTAGNGIFLRPGGTGTVANTGSILGASAIPFGGTVVSGIRLNAGGSVGNSSATALIQGFDGVYIIGGAGAVTNSGTIFGLGTTYGAATVVAAVGLDAGGSVGNTGTAALIQGYNGVFITGGAGTVTNSGMIIGTGTTVQSNSAPAPSGIRLNAGGSVGNTDTAALIQGQRGVYILGGAGTVANSGTIRAIGGYDFNHALQPTAVKDAVLFRAGGSVGNTGTAALIQSVYSGFYVGGGAGTVTNSGTILSTGTHNGYGNVVEFLAGGTVVNTGTAALIQGVIGGVGVPAGGGAVINSGTILVTGGGNAVAFTVKPSLAVSVGNAGLIQGHGGVALYGNGGSSDQLTVTNSGTIRGSNSGSGFGIYVKEGGTIVDSGTISGATAVAFGGLGTNLLVLEPGYQITGGIAGSGAGGGNNTLGLGGSAGAALTVNYNGLALSNFQEVLFGGGGHDTLKMSNNTGTLPVRISGFTLASDVIDLTLLANGTIVGGNTLNGSHQLVVTNGSQTETLRLDASDDYTGLTFTPSPDGSGGTNIDVGVPCFCRGTLILTEAGEMEVEKLAIGDKVVTLSGAARPIRWIGWGRTLVTPRNRCDVSPVIIRAGALADNVPHRDLHVTRRHAILVGAMLVPAEHLINGVSVVWNDGARVVEYYHVELDTHDVMRANGAPAESFRDDDSRLLFQNAGVRPPRVAPEPPCRPLIDNGPLLEQAWRTVARRAGQPPERWLTRDPDLHLRVDGRRLDPVLVADGMMHFRFDQPKREVCLVSRSCIPAAHGLGRDLRRLGVGVVGLTLFYPGGRRILPLCAEELEAGFHAVEGDIRWTKGVGMLSARLFKGMSKAMELEVRFAADLMYSEKVVVEAMRA